MKSRQYAISAVLVPSEIPDRTQRRELRQAGVLLSVWEGYDEGVLRFQLNRLISGENQSAVRGSRRAPVHTPVRILVGGREKAGVLYSVSEGGCFIDSPRASMDGAQLQTLFVLEERSFDLEGVVAFTNVPGNLQRPNLPLGMGVQFQDIPEAVGQSLAEFIRNRIESLEV